MQLIEAYDLSAGRGGRCWIYQCVEDSCRTEHVYFPDRGLHQLLDADHDDTEVAALRVDLATAGDPL